MPEPPAATLITALGMPALLIGPDDRVLAANAHCTPLFGADLKGRHFITVLRQPTLIEAIERAAATGQGQTTRYRSAEGGRDTTWQCHISALQQAPDSRTILITFQDLTDMLEATQMRREFVSNVSHELRTPLTSILGFVETLQGPARNDPGAQERFLGIIHTEATRMAQLVDDLLSLSRVEEEERKRPTAPVELAPLVRSVLTGLEPLAAANTVTLRFEDQADGANPPGDPRQLAQVLTNLVENAIKYGGPGKTVTVRLEPVRYDPSLRSEAFRLSVQDEGEGIPEHHIPRLTERFYRLDSHRSRELGGTGLGLAIVKHIVNRHRGRLHIASTAGAGSLFSVLLPRT